MPPDWGAKEQIVLARRAFPPGNGIIHSCLTARWFTAKCQLVFWAWASRRRGAYWSNCPTGGTAKYDSVRARSLSRDAIEFAVLSVALRLVTPQRLAPAGMSGTRSTRAASAPRAPTSGLRPSVSHVGAGRRIPIGMQNERATVTFIAPNDEPVKDR